MLSADPPTPDDFVSVVKDRRLSGRDGELRLVEDDLRPRRAVRGDGRGRVAVAVTDARREARRALGRRAGDPVHVVRLEGGAAELLARPDHDARIGGLEAEHVHRPSGREPEALALADRQPVDALMAAEDRAAGINNVA